MRKLYAFLLASFLVLFGSVSRAQVANYQFTQNINGTYTVNTDAGRIILGSASSDDEVFNNNTAGQTAPITNTGFPIGFNFTYNGIVYDKFAVSTNGWIVLGTGSFQIAGTGNYTALSYAGPAGYVSAIAALARDLQGQAGSEMSYETLGSAPNRILVMQWKGFRRFGGSGQNYNFQLRLNETSNTVQIVYGSFTESSATNGVPQVGLRGNTNADFNNRSGLWSNPIPGTLNTASMTFSTVAGGIPTSGLTYTWTPAVSACAGTPTAGSISGASSLCTGTLTTLNLNGYTFPQSGISIQWKSSAVSGGPYSNIATAVNNQYNFTPSVGGTTYYVATVTCANGGASATTAEFVQTVNAAVIGVNPTAITICPGDPVILTASGGVSYTWAPATGLSATTGNPVTASPAATTTYTVTGTAANGCTSTATSTITVKPATVVTVLPTISNVCVGTPTNLNASATPQPYGLSTIAFSPIPTPGAGVTTLSNAGVAVVPVVAGGDLDDGRWENIALPFPFTLYGTAYTAVTIGTNGWISMGATSTTNTGYNVTLPAAGAPNAVIDPMNGDMDQRTVGVTQYFTAGLAPNRIFVVNFNGVGFFGTSGTGTVQALLYEGTNVIEFHTTSITNTATNKSQAIENATGTVAHIVTGRNNAGTWTGVPDAWRFTPGSISYTWSPATGLNMTTGPSVIANPAVTTVYTVTATDASTGCSGTATSTINVTAPTISSQPVSTTTCTNQTTNFTVATNVPPTGYQWQINTGSGFFDLTNLAPFSGVNSATLVITNPGTVYSGNTFRVNITTTCGNLQSNTVTLTVNQAPTITVAPSGVCGPVTLTAQGNSNTYAWAPALGLNTTTGAVVIASPAATTIYTVTGTITATGCQNTATSTVLATPPVPVITPSPATICAGQFQALTATGGQTSTFSNVVSVNIPGVGTGTNTGSPASVYPVPIVVSGLPTSGVKIKSITINGITHTFPEDIDMLVQSPAGGTNIILMSDIGGGNAISGVNYTFDDAGPSLTTGLNTSGTYKPTNLDGGGLGIEPDNWDPPGPGSVAQANPALSSFAGNPNGTWNLYVVDDAGLDQGSFTGWSITFSVSTVTWTPATGLYLTPNTSQPYVLGTPANVVYASPSVATTYTAINTYGTCVSGPATVLVNVNPVPVVTVGPNNQCAPVTLTATSPTANTYSWSPATGLNTTTGAAVVANPVLATTYTVTGTITATGCQGTATANVNPTPGAPTIVPSAPTICLGQTQQLTATAGPGQVLTTISSGNINIPIPDNTAAGISHTLTTPAIPLGSSVNSIIVNFNINHTFDGDLIINLKAPNGNVITLSLLEGGGGVNFTNTNISSTSANWLFNNVAPFTGTFAADGVSFLGLAGLGPTGFQATVNNWANMFSQASGNWTIAINDNAGADVGTLLNWSITLNYSPGVVWTPITGLFNDALTTSAYVAGTPKNIVYAKPLVTTTYTANSAIGSCTGPGTSVTVTVLQPVTITTHPANTPACVGTNATFTVVAGGNNLTYQWQVSVGGGPFNDIPGATNASLTLNAVTLAMSGNQYRVKVANNCFNATSNAATLTVNPLPVVSVVTVMPNKICLSDTLIALVGSPVGGVWTGIGVSNSNFIPSATAVGTFTLTYTYANVNNCVNTATIVAKVQDCPERIRELDNDALTLYPNPNNGVFNIRVNSQLYTQLFMSVYTAGGQLVRRTEIKGLVYGRVIAFDFRNLPGGTYMVRFVNVAGVRTSVKTFEVVIAKH